VLLGISRRSATKMIDEGHVKAFRLPGMSARRIHHDDLVAFLKSDPSYAFALAKLAGPAREADPR
jgi:excisionase family DNA binding protein